jgi:hypothetical protein
MKKTNSYYTIETAQRWSSSQAQSRLTKTQNQRRRVVRCELVANRLTEVTFGDEGAQSRIGNALRERVKPSHFGSGPRFRQSRTFTKVPRHPPTLRPLLSMNSTPIQPFIKFGRFARKARLERPVLCPVHFRCFPSDLRRRRPGPLPRRFQGTQSELIVAGVRTIQ